MAKILIGCRLPHGLTIVHPNPEAKLKQTLRGIHSARPLVVSYVTTEVDVDLWEAWKHAYSGFSALKNGAIFEARSPQEAKVKAEDLKSQKTGFEPVHPESMGVTKRIED